MKNWKTNAYYEHIAQTYSKKREMYPAEPLRLSCTTIEPYIHMNIRMSYYLYADASTFVCKLLIGDEAFQRQPTRHYTLWTHFSGISVPCILHTNKHTYSYCRPNTQTRVYFYSYSLSTNANK